MSYPKRHPGTGFQPDRLKQKRDQLVSILSGKMKAQLSIKDPKADQRIREEITQLFATHATPSEQDLKKIERALKQEFNGQPSAPTQPLKGSASQSNLFKQTAEANVLGTSQSMRSIGIANMKTHIPSQSQNPLSSVRRSLGTEDQYWAQIMENNI